MNLKEAFRYQNFLDTLLNGAVSSLTHPNHCLKVTKTHHCSKANSEAEDFVEEVEAGRLFTKTTMLYNSWSGLSTRKVY